MDWQSIYGAVFGMGEVIAPEYLLICLVVGFLLWRRRKPGIGFWAWFTPRRIWTHRSHRLDLALFGMSRLLMMSGLLARLTVTPVVALALADAMGTGAREDVAPWVLAALAFVAMDFAKYWLHRVLHGSRRLWPIHALHHSAEVMTPITTYRQHPLWIMASTMILTALLGVVLGLVVGTLAPDATMTEVAGINAFIVLANAGLATFHHSHVWIGFGPVLERIVISPAMHQIHHSTRPEHHDRNFGETLAIWDWAFGTLYLTRGEEDVAFGLEGRDGRDYAAHGIGTALILPLRRLMAPRG
ncbi:sterol desaturase family protein [uncultured Jannaschia sp.]|uniref:sterol desaturase family protein n=1 Tax=uncultured Jannaschia sp. TaxID=293347 RepID=UPI00260E2FDE|nr:sterol desaturase family protein [uncultured Jannaschia sp.]